MSEIIQAVFAPGKTFVKTDPQWQYNKGQKLQILGLDLPEYFEAHFSNKSDGSAKRVLGQDGIVSIPTEYFIPGENIYCWLYIQEGEAHITRCQIRIPLHEKGEPIDEDPIPEQKSALEQAIDALNDATGKAEAAAESAEQSRDAASESASQAEHWAELAQQGAEEAGYVWFETDLYTGEIMVTVAGSLENDIQFEINAATGEMEVVFYD